MIPYRAPAKAAPPTALHGPKPRDAGDPPSRWSPGGLLLALGIALAAAYFLAPSDWEPGAESLKNWMSARVFRRTGGFPVLHHGWLYNLYLQVFLSLPYPLSGQLEHLTTQTFAYASLLLLLRRFLSPAWCVALLCAWIPDLWTLEAGARVMGLSCLALYLAQERDSRWNRGLIPVPLAAAAVLDTLYIPFLGGHALGVLIGRYREGMPLLSRPSLPTGQDRSPWLAKLVLATVIVVSVSFQSRLPDHNVYGIDYPWTPVPPQSILSTASLQVADWRFVTQRYPESQWMYKDWYVTHKEAFGEAKTLAGAFVANPRFYTWKIYSDFHNVLWSACSFLVGFRPIPTKVLRLLLPFCWLVLLACGYEASRSYRVRGEEVKTWAVGAGLLCTTAALSLVYVAARYTLALLPAGLILQAHLGDALRLLGSVARRVFHGESRQASHPAVNALAPLAGLVILEWVLRTFLPVEGRLEAARRAVFLCAGLAACAGTSAMLLRGDVRRSASFIGALLAATAVLGSEWPLRAVLPPAADLALAPRAAWLAGCIALLAGSVAIVRRPCRFDGAVLALSERRRTSPLAAKAAVAVLIVLVLSASARPLRPSAGTLLGRNPFALRGPLWQARDALLGSLSRGKRILALECGWIRSFGDVDMEKVYSPLYLPPFQDGSGATERFLAGLDVIWVSDALARPAWGVGTQIYLRYELFLKPFLDRALREGWTVETVGGFGKIYRRGSVRG